MIDSIEHRISVIKYACVISAVLTMQSCGNRITNVSPTDPIPLADALSGEDLYNERCANCHDGPVARAPHRIVFPLLGSEHVLASMNDGIMQAQAAGLTELQRTTLAEYLGERPIQRKTESQLLFCDEKSDGVNQGISANEFRSWGIIFPCFL